MKELIDKLHKHGFVENDNKLEKELVDNYINKVNSYTNKPNIMIFTSFEFALDVITPYANYLKEYFNIFKVFTNATTNDHSEDFISIFSMKRDFESFKRILSETNFDAIIVANIGYFYHWYVPFFQYYAKDTKVFSIEKDFTSYFMHPLEDEYLKHFGTIERVNIAKECEEYSISNSDGIITNNKGSIVEEQIRPKVKNLHTILPLKGKSRYRFNEVYDLSDGVSIVYAGNLLAEKNEDMYNNYSNLKSLFSQITSTGIHIDAYALGDIDILRDYYQGIDDFNFYEAIKIDELLGKIYTSSFGSIINDLSRYDKKYYGNMYCTLPTKIFTYLAAGLPIIINEEYIAAKEFILDNKVGFSVSQNDLKDLKSKIDTIDYKELKRNVKQFQENFTVDIEQKKLKDFILKVIEK
jgi:hypothetical protein